MLPAEKREKALELAETFLWNMGAETTIQEILNYMSADDALECVEYISRQWGLKGEA